MLRYVLVLHVILIKEGMRRKMEMDPMKWCTDHDE